LQTKKLRQAISQLLTPSPHEDPIIDGLRGLSILLIILFHCFYGVMVLLRKPEPILAFIQSLPNFTAPLLASDKAVDIFFVISAYLVGGSLFRILNNGGTIDVVSFYGKRVFRIYPLFLLALLLYAPINLTRSWRYLPYNLFFIDNYPFRSIIPVGWSLSIEMQFYFLLPWISVYLFKLNHQWRPRVLWGLFTLSLAIPILVCLKFPVAYQTPFYKFHPDLVDPTVMMDELYYPTHTRFGPFVLGLILALRNINGSNPARYPSVRLVGGLLLMGMMLHFPVYNPAHWYYQPFNPMLNLFLQSWHRLFFCLGLYLFMTGIRQSTSLLSRLSTFLLSMKLWRPFSQAVFPIYLFHFPMIALAGLTVFGGQKPDDLTQLSLSTVLLIFVVASIYSVVLGGVIHIYIEQPFLKKGVRWLNRLSNTSETVRKDRQAAMKELP